MKSLYIIPFLLLSVTFFAQDKKSSAELQNQEQVLKDAKAFEQKMQKQNEVNSAKKEKPTTLASDQGLEVKEQSAKTDTPNNNQGKLLPNTASFEEVLATIPNRKSSQKASASVSNPAKIQGLPNTATLEEIKKTIPRN